MAESEYVKVRKQILADIADALRTQKNSTKRYNIADVATVMRSVAVIPTGEASSTLSLAGMQMKAAASGLLPTVHKGAANATLDLSTMKLQTSAVGELTE